MNIDNRATKLYLKKLPPVVAVELLEKYMIPSPYKEIIHMTCVKNYPQYKAMKELSKVGINLSFRSFTRKQAEALEKFRIAHLFCNQP